MSLSMSFILFFIFSIFLYPFSSYSRSTISPSVASKQQLFWSSNILNSMPEPLVPKLSPLTITESQYFALLVSDGSIASHKDFCSLGNLACNVNLSRIRILGEGYGYVDGNISSSFEKVDEHSFFRLSKLKEGNDVDVPIVRDSYPSRAFLPYEIASKISMDLMELQKLFPQSFTYQTTTDAMRTTILYCRAPVLKGEVKTCSSSLEGMISFAKSALGQKQLLALSSKSVYRSSSKLLINKITRFNTNKIVSCHDVFLPFSTYFCHVLSSTRLFAVDVVDSETGIAVKTALAVCHMDTSTWPTKHVAFKVLNSSPGKGEACHWMTHIDLVFISGAENNTRMK